MKNTSGKAEAVNTGIYLIFVEGDIEPRIVGPFADGDERDKKARELRSANGPDHGIFMLDVHAGNSIPSVRAYCGGFFLEDDET